MKAIVPKPIEGYAAAHSTPHSALLDELAAYTLTNCPRPQMLTGRLAGGLLRMLVKLTGARRILEVGLYTGYSALTMAEALPDDGAIISCEIEPELATLARSFFNRSPHGRKIEVRMGPALATLQALPADVEFDLVFLDADKENYCAYYQELLPRLRTGGLLIADNTLWSGSVLKPEEKTDRAIVAFNDLVQGDPQVENVLLTLRDGMTLIRKL